MSLMCKAAFRVLAFLGEHFVSERRGDYEASIMSSDGSRHHVLGAEVLLKNSERVNALYHSRPTKCNQC